MENTVNCKRCFYCIKREEWWCRKLDMDLTPRDMICKCKLFTKRLSKDELRKQKEQAAAQA